MKDPDISTFEQLFEGNVQYRAPVFQRLYVWGEDQFGSLIDDIDAGESSASQFLGAIVLKDLGKAGGATAPATFLLIDGQQRITTLYLFLLAIASVASRDGLSDFARDVWSNFLANTRSGKYVGWPKVVLTLQDRHTLQELSKQYLSSLGWDFRNDPAESKPRLSDALMQQWERIFNYVARQADSEGGRTERSRLEGLLGRLLSRLHVISITLDGGDDETAIFSRLNARGVPLELSDLVRNEVFAKYHPDESKEADRFYHRNWHPLEKRFPPGSLSLFLPAYAFITCPGKVTLSNAFRELQHLWKDRTPNAIVDELQRYTDGFLAIVVGENMATMPASVATRLQRLSEMPRTRAIWSFVMSLLVAVREGTLDDKSATDTLDIVESFLVRRALVGREATGLHAVFRPLWNATFGKPSRVRAKLRSGGVRCPDDDELKDFLVAEAVDGRQIVRYVLTQRERDIATRKGFDPPSVVQTIEHVLPRNLNEAWQEHFTESEHRHCVGLIGNLLPLSERQNKSIQDQDWRAKRQRLKGSAFSSARDAAKRSTWTSKEIDAATGEMAEWIIKRWRPIS